jgi:hypothetical protein
MARATWFHSAGKSVAVAASTGAALVSIISALYSYGVLGESESHQSIGNLGAAWVRLRPTVDTAFAIGDTIHFAATIADKNGSILVGARPTWTSGDSTVAETSPDGAVIARGPGQTTISVVVGNLVAQSRLVVKQRVAGVVISSGTGDTSATILEGGELQLRARALDSRGHTIVQAGAVWHVDDSSVAALDDKGLLTGRNAGRSVVSAKVDGASGYLPVAVVTTATSLNVTGGGAQRALAGHALPQPIVVRATNRKGAPAPGKTVTFRLAEGAGKVDPDTATTDADGRARTVWTLGDYPGRQRLLVNVENIDSATVVVAESDPVAANTRISALVEQLRAPAGGVVPDSVAVRVTDSTGRALADVPVQWTVVDGGSIEALAPRTDSLGLARAKWTLATKTGPQRVRAQVGSGTAASGRGIAPVTLIATAAAGSAADVAIVAGDRQRAAAGTALKKEVVFKVVDANGNGVADMPLVLSLSAGSVADSAPRSDSLGLARVQWTLGRSAGEHTLAVHVDGIKKLLKLTAHATPGAAANLSFEDAPPDKTARTRAKRLFAVVTDEYGNPVPEAPVTFASKSGTVAPARAVTDAKGRVALRWTPGASVTEQTLSGTVRSTSVKGAYVLTQADKPAASKPTEKTSTKTPAPPPRTAASATKTHTAASPGRPQRRP